MRTLSVSGQQVRVFVQSPRERRILTSVAQQIPLSVLLGPDADDADLLFFFLHAQVIQPHVSYSPDLISYSSYPGGAARN